MQWQVCVALILFVAGSYPAQAARISDVKIKQRWPQKQVKIRNSPIDYVLLPDNRGGYRRRYVHALGKAAPATTTERPLVRVWNSFVRSVQPAFSFGNLTNPLANFFNDGSANIIETSPVLIQSYDEQELPYEEPAPVASQSSSNKRKRKRRKQLKRRPVYDDENDGPYGPYEPYYGPPPPPAHAQPMFFYDTNSGSYYGVQKFSPHDFQASFYHYQDQQQPQSEPEDAEEPAVMRRLGNRKVTLLRPLPVSPAKGQSPAKSAEVSEPEGTNESDDTIEETDSDSNSEDSSASGDAATGEDDSDIATQSPLSESMRNALGTYMRDDRHTRQRQRQSSDGAGALDAGAKVSPRVHPRRFFRLGAW